MREVYAVGVGITSFTRLEYPLSEIAAYPAMMALKDAGLSKVDHVYVANMGSARLNHQTGLASAVVDTLSLTPAGAEVIENFGAVNFQERPDQRHGAGGGDGPANRHPGQALACKAGGLRHHEVSPLRLGREGLLQPLPLVGVEHPG